MQAQHIKLFGTGTWIESQNNKTENSPELNPSKYKNLIYDKNIFKWGKHQLFNKFMMLGQQVTHFEGKRDNLD